MLQAYNFNRVFSQPAWWACWSLQLRFLFAAGRIILESSQRSVQVLLHCRTGVRKFMDPTWLCAVSVTHACAFDILHFKVTCQSIFCLVFLLAASAFLLLLLGIGDRRLGQGSVVSCSLWIMAGGGTHSGAEKQQSSFQMSLKNRNPQFLLL